MASGAACPELWATLGDLSKADIAELRSFMVLPARLDPVVHALCIAFGVAPERRTETFPPGSGKKPVVHLQWSKRVLDIDMLRGYSPDALTDAQREELVKVAVRLESRLPPACCSLLAQPPPPLSALAAAWHQAHGDFTFEAMIKTSKAGAALVTWTKKVLELSAGNTPLKRARTALAAAAGQLEVKEAQLAKAQAAVAQLEGEVRVLRAEREAAEQAVAAVSGAVAAEAAGGGGGSA